MSGDCLLRPWVVAKDGGASVVPVVAVVDPVEVSDRSVSDGSH
jgi:hypothetical protein